MLSTFTFQPSTGRASVPSAVKPPAQSAETIPNVLAERYASPAMKDIWSAARAHPAGARFLDRRHEGQRDLGVAIPAEAIKDYERVRGDIDLVAHRSASASPSTT
jgi:hypothetical protein